MAHRGEEPWLLHQLTEIEILFVRDLEGDLLVDPGVFREVHAAETAAAERRQDAVFPNGLTAKEQGDASIAGCDRPDACPRVRT
jgi:hypothetical protein